MDKAYTDTGTVHSHIVVNAVNPLTGKKLQFSPKDYVAIKDEVNRLGKEHGYTETDFRKRGKNSRTAAERKIMLNGGVSWKEELREVIAEAIGKSKDEQEFKNYLKACYGVEITRSGKDYSYLHPQKQKPIRGAKLGTNYTKSEVFRKLGKQNNGQKPTANNGYGRQCKRKQTDMGEMSIFSGIVYCADCGKKMYLCRCSKSTQKEYFNCSTYRKKSKSLCSSHQITVEAVEHIVLTDLQRALGMAKDNEKQFVDILQTAKSKEIRKDLSAKTKECDEAEKRVKALDHIIQSLYEDKVCGNLTDERFVKMSQAYEHEQETLMERIKVLRKELSTAKEDADNVTKFMRLVKRYTEITELTPEVVREFIEKVIVHQAEKVNGKKYQAVEIIYNCMGVIPNPTQE